MNIDELLHNFGKDYALGGRRKLIEKTKTAILALTNLKPLEEKEVEELKVTIQKLSMRLDEGRTYLMGVHRDKITVEDTLEAFGFGRNGLGGGI